MGKNNGKLLEGICVSWADWLLGRRGVCVRYGFMGRKYGHRIGGRQEGGSTRITAGEQVLAALPVS